MSTTRKVVLTIFILIMTSVASYIIYDYYKPGRLIIPMPSNGIPVPPPPPPAAKLEAGPLKVEIGEDNSWETILKLVSTILFTYAGIRLINKRIT